MKTERQCNVQFRSIALLRNQSKTSTDNEESKINHVHKGFDHEIKLISKELN